MGKGARILKGKKMDEGDILDTQKEAVLSREPAKCRIARHLESSSYGGVRGTSSQDEVLAVKSRSKQMGIKGKEGRK